MKMLLRLVFLLLSIKPFFVRDVRYFKVNCTSVINELQNANKNNEGSISSMENSQFENDVTSNPETIGPLRKSPESILSRFFTKNSPDCISTAGNTDVTTPEKEIRYDEKYIKETINSLRRGKTFDHQKLEILLNKAADLLKKEETIVSVQVPADGKLVIIGDLNGHFKNFISIIRFFGIFPNDKLYFLFNGDLVNEGENGSEILIAVLLLKLRFPKYVFLNRGHQEDYYPCHSKFYSEMQKKYNETFYERITTDVFPAFPIAHKINDKIFIVHGGIPSSYKDKELDLNEFNPKFQRTEFKMVYSDEPIPFEEIEGNSLSADFKSKNELTRTQYTYGLIDFLWSDPYNGSSKFTKGPRGMYHTLFNVKATDNFFKKNKLSFLIRSHEASDGGYFFFHDKKGLTIHSCPNYKSKIKNYGSVAVFSQNSESIEIFQFKSKFNARGEFSYEKSYLRCECTKNKLFKDEYKKGGSIFCKCRVKLAETFQVKTVEYPQKKPEQDELTQ